MSKLTPHVISIIKSTAPVLVEHGEDIIRAFYQSMFTNHPEVELHFNPANQVSGNEATRYSQHATAATGFFGTSQGDSLGKQQRSLFNAVVAYATNIDNLGALGDAVETIAHKHVGVGIKNEQYPIVGTELLCAIKRVLGDAATDEVIGAWKEAYFVLADILIAREDELRDAAPWQGFREFVVDEKVPEASGDVVSIYFKSLVEGPPVPTYKPGQFIALHLTNLPPHDASFKLRKRTEQYRNYTISRAPADASRLRITVRREPERGDHPVGVVSTFFHDQLKPGDRVKLGGPFGAYTLSEADTVASRVPLVIVGAGVGATVATALFEGAVQSNVERPLVFVQCARDAAQALWHEHLQSVAKNHKAGARVCLVLSNPAAGDECDHAGRLSNADTLRKIVGEETASASYYFTGPPGFMADFYRFAREAGASPASLHFECFGPLDSKITG